MGIIKEIFSNKPQWTYVGDVIGDTSGKIHSANCPPEIPNWIIKKAKKIQIPPDENLFSVYKFKGKKYRYKIESFLITHERGTTTIKLKFYKKLRTNKIKR
jgi:hypothetical protein